MLAKSGLFPRLLEKNSSSGLAALHYILDKSDNADNSAGVLNGGMEPKQLRINDANDPDRATKFKKSLARSAADGNAVVRELIDAYNRFVTKHERGPAFPVEIVEKRLAKKRGGK